MRVLGSIVDCTVLNEKRTCRQGKSTLTLNMMNLFLNDSIAHLPNSGAVFLYSCFMLLLVVLPQEVLEN